MLLHQIKESILKMNIPKDYYFRTIFALIFASTNLGSSALFFQDFGKAKLAITRVIKLMTIPTTLPLNDDGEKPVSQIYNLILFDFSYF